MYKSGENIANDMVNISVHTRSDCIVGIKDLLRILRYDE